ncbi:MAG: hypothetical protein U0516_03155 [Candidatus Saccharibacteria bacterium]
MFYFGYVTKEQFIKRLRRELRRASTIVKFNSEHSTPDTLVVHVQDESTSVVVISATYVDLGNALHIQLDLCEILLVKGMNRFDVVNPVMWENRLYGIRQRKNLRDYCKKLAQLIHHHISEINNVQPSEFYEPTV